MLRCGGPHVLAAPATQWGSTSTRAAVGTPLGSASAWFGVHAEPSLLDLVAVSRRGPSAEVLVASTKLIGRLPVITSPADPRVARHALIEGGVVLVDCLRTHAVDGVLDLGRIDDESPTLALAARADVVLLVTRPRIDEVQALVFRRDLLREAGCAPQLVPGPSCTSGPTSTPTRWPPCT